jgi:hypothetical protein
MTRTSLRHIALATLTVALLSLAIAVFATPPPEQVITKADIEKVAGGKWKERSPEPGVIFYEEEGGKYRQINVYLFPPDGKTVAGIRDAAVANGEEGVETLAGLGDDAMFRAQFREATVEKAGKDGPQLLSVAVHEVSDAGETKKIAVELLKLGVARLQ